MRQNIPILSLFFVDVILFSRLGMNAKHDGAFLSKNFEENAKIMGKKARCRPAYHRHHGIFHGAVRAVLTPFPLRKSKTSDFFDTNLGTLWAKVRHFVLKKADVSGLPSRHFYVSLPIFRPFSGPNGTESALSFIQISHPGGRILRKKPKKRSFLLQEGPHCLVSKI